MKKIALAALAVAAFGTGALAQDAGETRVITNYRHGAGYADYYTYNDRTAPRGYSNYYGERYVDDTRGLTAYDRMQGYEECNKGFLGHPSAYTCNQDGPVVGNRRFVGPGEDGRQANDNRD
jgi:hypothetical protein